MICRRLWLCILAAVLGSAAGGGKRYQEEEKVGRSLWRLVWSSSGAGFSRSDHSVRE